MKARTGTTEVNTIFEDELLVTTSGCLEICEAKSCKEEGTVEAS
jgi:hypothetical protein